MDQKNNTEFFQRLFAADTPDATPRHIPDEGYQGEVSTESTSSWEDVYGFSSEDVYQFPDNVRIPEPISPLDQGLATAFRDLSFIVRPDARSSVLLANSSSSVTHPEQNIDVNSLVMNSASLGSQNNVRNLNSRFSLHQQNGDYSAAGSSLQGTRGYAPLMSNQQHQELMRLRNMAEEERYRMFHHEQYLLQQQQQQHTPFDPHVAIAGDESFNAQLSRHPRQQCSNRSTYPLSPPPAQDRNCRCNGVSQWSPSYNIMDDIKGSVYLMAKDWKECCILRRALRTGTRRDINMIFIEIIGHAAELMTDTYGNDLMQMLLDVCNEDQRLHVLLVVTGTPGLLIRISCHEHGTRAFQKVIRTLKTPMQFDVLVSALEPVIVTLMKDLNGKHVARCCVQYLRPEYSKFLFEAAASNCVELATDPRGCCMLKDFLSHSTVEQRCCLVSGISSNALLLCHNPYGNYVVQSVLELQEARNEILDLLEGQYVDLSMQKFSSNVVEKCLSCADEEHHTRIIIELIRDPRLDQVIQDPYGNYVIQTALKSSKGVVHAALLEAIEPHFRVLRTSPYGKKILSMLQK